MSRLAGIRFNFPLAMIGRNLSRLFGLKFSAGKQGSCNNHLRRPEAIDGKILSRQNGIPAVQKSTEECLLVGMKVFASN